MSFLEPNELIKAGGLALIAFIVFAESGLLFGFFFPGDTLLFAAGVLAATGEFNIVEVTAVIVFAAIAGGYSGYWIGKKAGPKLFKKEEGIIFRREYIERSERFYEKHGGKTIMFARFIPVIRTFAPVVAGIGNMNQAKFMFYNVVGAAFWGISITLAGFFFGSKIPNIEAYVFPILLLAMALTVSPTIYHILKDPRARQKIAEKLRRIL
ncbi:VTT domain-containing protein [Candidatus Parcubacteria bacterium]|nr:VTT domain-containing protein [Candidatus Parcubacteria bacterium]